MLLSLDISDNSKIILPFHNWLYLVLKEWSVKIYVYMGRWSRRNSAIIDLLTFLAGRSCDRVIGRHKSMGQKAEMAIVSSTRLLSSAIEPVTGLQDDISIGTG